MPCLRSIATDIRPLVERFANELTTLIQRLAQEQARAAVLRALGVGGGCAGAVTYGARRGPGRLPKAAAVPKRRSAPASPVQPRARKLQGQCMRGLRGMTKMDQGQVKKMRAAKGIEAAIELARKLKAKAAA